MDTRPLCSSPTEYGLLCSTRDEDCPNPVRQYDICIKGKCFNFLIIIIGIFLGSGIGVIIDAALLFSLSISNKLTFLDKLKDPEFYSRVEQSKSPYELDMDKATSKCIGQCGALIAIVLLVFFGASGIVTATKYSYMNSLGIEFSIAFGIEQAKGPLAQLIVHFDIDLDHNSQEMLQEAHKQGVCELGRQIHNGQW